MRRSEEGSHRIKNKGERLREAVAVCDTDSVASLLQNSKLLESISTSSHILSFIDDQDQYGSTALMIASAAGYVELVSELLEKKANPNVRDKYGSTALIIACSYGHFRVAELLLENSSKSLVNAATEAGHTPLIKAASINHVHSVLLVEVLVRNKANVNAAASDGSRAIHCAVKNNNVHIVQYLVQHGADINAQTNDGMTPLMIAADNRSFAMITELIAVDADPERKNAKGHTLFEVAKLSVPPFDASSSSSSSSASSSSSTTATSSVDEPKSPLFSPKSIESSIKYAIEKGKKLKAERAAARAPKAASSSTVMTKVRTPLSPSVLLSNEPVDATDH